MRNILTQYENEWKTDPGLSHADACGFDDTPPVLSTRQQYRRMLRTEQEQGEARTVRIDEAAILGAELHAARVKGAWTNDTSSVGRQRVEKWRRALDDCIVSTPPNATEWAHGVPSVASHADGAHVVYDLGTMRKKGEM